MAGLAGSGGTGGLKCRAGDRRQEGARSLGLLELSMAGMAGPGLGFTRCAAALRVCVVLGALIAEVGWSEACSLESVSRETPVTGSGQLA